MDKDKKKVDKNGYKRIKKSISNGRNRLTRNEMLFAIRHKYPSLWFLSIEGRKEWTFIDGKATRPYIQNYVKRKYLFNVIIEMKLHKSRHLTKKQKEKVKYELNEQLLDKL